MSSQTTENEMVKRTDTRPNRTHETPQSTADDAQERKQEDCATREQPDDDAQRFPSRKGSVPVSER